MATGLIAKFPESFCQRPHFIAESMGCAAWQWQLLDEEGECLVSVVGGPPVVIDNHAASMLHGNGVDTFEMWDMVNEPEPRPWMTKDEINAYLVEKGIVDPVFEDLNIEIIEPKEEET
jgi:hypothetical protein